MTSPSNLYAEKVFSEHPIGLWPLDDKVDFVSLLDINEKGLGGWSVTSQNATINSASNISVQVEDSPTVQIVSSSLDKIEIKSPVLTTTAMLDQSKNSITASMHFKSGTDATVEIGYFVNNTSQAIKSFEFASGTDSWAFLSAEFSLPTIVGDIFLYISITQPTEVENSFFINALSFGQWTESFATASSGNVLDPISDYINVDMPISTYCVPAQSYGLSDVDGYYLASANKLYATNRGFPMVYGASNVTGIEANGSLPSLIIPGFGFLNDSGKNTSLTAEMWVRLTPNSHETKRIFGPIASSDGIYVDGEFITIKVGKYVGSHFINEWGRPMLLDFHVSNDSIGLLIDGEQAISIVVDSGLSSLPLAYSDSGKEQDWLGFYSYSSIDSFEIDCVAIYPYQVSEVIAKRRFVYGQGVEFPETSSSSLIGASTFIDYQVANYANNYIYPDMGRWNQGIKDNVRILNNSLMSPSYELPDTVFNNTAITQQQWLDKCSIDANSLFASVDLSLADSQTRSGGYLYFQKARVLSSNIRGFYGVFKPASLDNQILIKMENATDNSMFVVSIDNSKIKYSLYYGGLEQISTYSQNTIEIGKIFVAGVDIDKFAEQYGGLVNKFFGAYGNISIYVGGQQSFENTFSGKIYKVGFSSRRNLNKISYLIPADGKIMVFEGDDAFINGGIPETVVWDESYVGGLPETIAWDATVSAGMVDSQSVLEMMYHVASYTLNPRLYLGSFKLDISADSYWQDYVPLSYLGKALVGPEGDLEQTLDFIQFNIASPEIKNIFAGYYNTDEYQVKTHVSFQYLQLGANKDSTYFQYTESLPESGVVKPGTNWLITKYEVVDGAVIYPPANENFEKLAIVLHIDIESRAIKTNPIKIKSLQLASQALSKIEATKINTRFGNPVMAYTMRGVYPDYKAFNPVAIYKSSTPYLYLTNSSGIKMKGMIGSTKRRGIRSNINEQRSNNYRVGAVQVLAKYAEPEFVGTQQKLITISASNKTISLYAQTASDDGKRARVVAINDKTGLIDQTVFFFLNGVPVKDLFLTPDVWNMVGLQFQESLDFNSFMGYLDITGPLLVHGMSNYRLTSSQDSVTSIFRTWSQVRTMVEKEGNALTYWQDFMPSSNDTDGISWQEILYIPTLKTYLVDPRIVYRLYTGTNKIVVGDSNKLRFGNYSYNVYNDVRWQSTILSAV